jgi:hypothetical protein
MTDADDLAARSKLETPEGAAVEAENERTDRAALEASHARTGQRPPDPLAGVLAAPGSAAARRALAAAWRAAGKPQAELIEHQLAYGELERTNQTASPAARALRASIDRLIAEHGQAWAGRIAALVDSYKYRRGLVAQVKLTGERFLAVAPELFALAPIQHVDLEAPLALEAVLASPFAGKLASLAIESQYGGVGDREAIAVAGARQLRGLRWLSLYANTIGEAGVEGLAASPYLERCVYVGLGENPADPTPSVNDFDGQYVVSRPPLGIELERTYGARPWLTGPAHGEPWPPDRDDLAITP